MLLASSRGAAVGRAAWHHLGSASAPADPRLEQPAWAPRDTALPSAVGTAKEAPPCFGTGWQHTDEKSLCPEPSGCVGAVGELGRCLCRQAAMAEEPAAWCCLRNPVVIARGAGAAAASSLTVPSWQGAGELLPSVPIKHLQNDTGPAWNSVLLAAIEMVPWGPGWWWLQFFSFYFFTSRMQIFNLLPRKRSLLRQTRARRRSARLPPAGQGSWAQAEPRATPRWLAAGPGAGPEHTFGLLPGGTRSCLGKGSR